MCRAEKQWGAANLPKLEVEFLAGAVEPGLCCHPGDNKWPEELQGEMAVLLKSAREARPAGDSSESIPRFLMGFFVVLSKILLGF